MDFHNPLWECFERKQSPRTDPIICELFQERQGKITFDVFANVADFLRDFNSKSLCSFGEFFTKTKREIERINELDTEVNAVFENIENSRRNSRLNTNERSRQIITISRAITERERFYTVHNIPSKKALFDSLGVELRKLKDGIAFLSLIKVLVIDKTEFNEYQKDFLSTNINIFQQNIFTAHNCLLQESNILLQKTRNIDTFSISFTNEGQIIKTPISPEKPFFLEPRYVIPEREFKHACLISQITREAEANIEPIVKERFLRQVKEPNFDLAELSNYKICKPWNFASEFKSFVQARCEHDIEQDDIRQNAELKRINDDMFQSVRRIRSATIVLPIEAPAASVVMRFVPQKKGK
ncbi:MAG: hypothetical protein LBF02_02775 [Mycoplasmataceae bacterium]|nr:hypothetical protein [Mycoplasmataceae bacterium]